MLTNYKTIHIKEDLKQIKNKRISLRILVYTNTINNKERKEIQLAFQDHKLETSQQNNYIRRKNNKEKKYKQRMLTIIKTTLDVTNKNKQHRN